MSGKERFLVDLKRKCKENNIRLYISSGRTMRFAKGDRVEGYFGGNPITLACAGNRSDYLELLVHESCHLDQFLECYNMFANHNSDLVWKWAHGKNIVKITKHLDRLRELELDCEKRSVRKIKKYKLSIKTDEYIQRANAYIWSYTYLKQYRYWPDPENAIYNKRKMWSKMSKRFHKNYSILPVRIEKLFNNYYNADSHT